MARKPTAAQKNIRGLRRGKGPAPKHPERIDDLTPAILRRLRRDTEFRGRFFKAHEPLVRGIARRYSQETSVHALPGGKLPGDYDRVVTEDDLVQAGHIGQMEAIETYDVKRCGKIKYSTWASQKIRRAIQADLRMHREGAARIPYSLFEKVAKEMRKPEGERDATIVREKRQIIRRVRRPTRIDHPTADDRPIKDMMPGPDNGTIPKDPKGTHIAKAKAEILSLQSDRPYGQPARTVVDRVATVIWDAPQPVTSVDVLDVLRESPWRAAQEGNAIERIRKAITIARRRGWIKTAGRNGMGFRWESKGAPRPPAKEERDIKILLLRLGLGRGKAEHWTLVRIGKRFRITRERVRQIEEKMLGRLTRERDLREILA